ncbi:helix-turn-helix domain-containing protein [Candidatus Woesearchaeota archaeon]|nr:helix-turn-helix domain-containing protein [Candidatus Woesearchaeota archaeon]
MDTQLLEDIGLTKSETKVYLGLLELGSSTTGKITDKAHVASSKIYELLEKLMQKGLVSFVIKSNTKYFEAADPKRLLDYIEYKEKLFQQQKHAVAKLIPQLQLQRTLTKHHSESAVYQGIEGLRSAFYEALRDMKKGSQAYSYGVPQRSVEVNRFFIHFHKDAHLKKVRINYLFNADAKGQLQTLKHHSSYHRIRFLSPSIKMPASVNIFGDHVIIFPYEESGEILLFSLKNKHTAASFKAQFDVFWHYTVALKPR